MTVIRSQVFRLEMRSPWQKKLSDMCYVVNYTYYMHQGKYRSLSLASLSLTTCSYYIHQGKYRCVYIARIVALVYEVCMYVYSRSRNVHQIISQRVCLHSSRNACVCVVCDVCWRMLSNCSHELYHIKLIFTTTALSLATAYDTAAYIILSAHADVCWRMLTCADVCWRMLCIR